MSGHGIGSPGLALHGAVWLEAACPLRGARAVEADVPLPIVVDPERTLLSWSGVAGYLAWGEGLQDPALGDRAMAALPDEGGQLSPKGAEIGELPVHLGQVLPRDGVNGLTGSLPLIGEVEEGADLLDGEA